MDQKLNVCLMNDSFPPIIDGVANAVINYANVITDKLGSATVVTPNHPNAEDNYNFPVVRYKSMAITEKLCGYRAGYPFSSSMLENLGDANFDIIHSHCPFASTVMARSLREKVNVPERKSKVPLVLTYHTKFDIDIKRAIPNEVMAKQVIKLIVDNISACDEVWTVSHGAGENLRSLGYTGDYRVMENGVDFPCGRASSEAVAELRAEYDLKDDVPVFLFVGRMLWYKGLRFILDALRIIQDKGIEYKMMFVGDGLDMQEVQDYAREIGVMDNCIFVGAVFDREDLRVYYTAGDLFLFPSEYDTNGIVVREAAACGVASLLVEGSCAAEGITHGRTGVLAKCENEAIAAELEFAAAHLDEVRQLGDNAMREVYISWETSVRRAYARYLDIIDNLNSGESQRMTKPLHEEFFSMVDSITDSIQNIRSLRTMPGTIRQKGKKYSERLKKQIEKHTSKWIE